jgi:hypothetical protein
MDLRKTLLLLALMAGALLNAGTGYAYTANKVWMEFRPNGRYRVYVNYTVPALKEFREVTVEFDKKNNAEKYYFDLVRGADFYIPDANQRLFINQSQIVDPW